MFEKFGEFDDYTGINKAAEGLKNEGDTDGLTALAKENGLGEDVVADYLMGDTPQLCTVREAALGRIDIEQAETNEDKTMMGVIFDMANMMILEDEDFALLVTKKGKRCEDILKKMREEARKKQKGGAGCVCGTDRDLQKRISSYYGEAKKA